MNEQAMTDDRLTLYYYKDGLSADERLEITNALATDPALAARYRALSAELSALAPASAEPLPADMLERFHANIDRAARAETQAATPVRRASTHWWSFLLGSAVTAALVLAVTVALRDAGTDVSGTAPLVVDAGPGPAYSNAAFQRSMQVYFRDSQRELSNMPGETDAERTALVLNLVAQNRLFEKLAAQNEAPDLARVLRAFEPILLRLAADDISAEDSELLRSQLAFELNVMLTKLTRESSERTQSTEQETRT